MAGRQFGVYNYGVETSDEYLKQIDEFGKKIQITDKFRQNPYSEMLKSIGTKFFDDVYYLHDYYPTSRFGYVHGNDVILAYKRQTSESIFQYITLELEAAIDAIITYFKPDKPIHLVAVPTSKVNIRSTLALSASIIVNNLNRKYHELGYRLIDDSSLLIRTEDTEESIMTGATLRDPEIRKASIKVNGETSNDYYIILDDIVTTGSTLQACKSRLGIKNNYYALVVGRTAYESSDEISKRLMREYREEADFEYRMWLEEILDATGESEEEFWSHES